MNKDLYCSSESYLFALEKQKERIENNLPLNAINSDEYGNNYTYCSWGLCCTDKEIWPNPEDHLWPDQFVKNERLAPKYRTKGQECPFDDKTKPGYELNSPNGCYYRCMIFQRSQNKKPTKKEAIILYQIKINKTKNNYK
jgi:hypothetical protein